MDKKTRNRSTLKQIEKEQVEEKRKMARTELYLNCRGHATIAINKLHGDGLDSVATLDWLSKSVDRVLNNDTNEIEAMLITQAKSLEYLFYDALTKLPNSSMERAEIFANIALRAQTGCRKTLMALAELKHPNRATTIIKQQNNAITQQVNNNVESESIPIENNKKVANKVVSEKKLEKMDSGRTAQTISVNAATETVDVFNRA